MDSGANGQSSSSTHIG